MPKSPASSARAARPKRSSRPWPMFANSKPRASSAAMPRIAKPSRAKCPGVSVFRWKPLPPPLKRCAMPISSAPPPRPAILLFAAPTLPAPFISTPSAPITRISASSTKKLCQRRRHRCRFRRAVPPGGRRSHPGFPRRRNLLDGRQETLRSRRRENHRPHERRRSHVVQVQRHRFLGSRRRDARLCRRETKRPRARASALVRGSLAGFQAFSYPAPLVIPCVLSRRAAPPRVLLSPGTLPACSSAFPRIVPSQRLPEPHLHVLRQRYRLRIAEDLHRHPRLIHHQLALAAIPQVLLQFPPRLRRKFSIEIFRELAYHVLAIHGCLPCRKYRSSFSRSFNRARSNRDFTAGIEIPRSFAVSSVESSSMSRSTKTVRKSGGNSPISRCRMSPISVCA